MSYFSEVDDTPPFTLSVGVKTNSTLGVMEKIDKKIQTEEVKVLPFDSFTNRLS